MAVILILVVGATYGMSHPHVDRSTVNNILEAGPGSFRINNDLPNNKNCYKDIVSTDAAEKISTTEDDSQASLSMARLYVKKRNNAKAIEYYEQAINEEKDITEKANYCYELAQVIYERKDYPKVRTLANQAISLNPKWGKPYILIGKIYADSSKSIGESDVQQRIVYCLAVDQFIKAKAIDPESAVEAEKEITQYSQYFPGNEDAHFENIKEGSNYKIGGWINESTIVRVR